MPPPSRCRASAKCSNSSFTFSSGSNNSTSNNMEMEEPGERQRRLSEYHLLSQAQCPHLTRVTKSSSQVIGARWTCGEEDRWTRISTMTLLQQSLRQHWLMPISRIAGRLPIAELGGRLDLTAGPIPSCLSIRIISAHGLPDTAQKQQDKGD